MILLLVARHKITHMTRVLQSSRTINLRYEAKRNYPKQDMRLLYGRKNQTINNNNNKKRDKIGAGSAHEACIQAKRRRTQKV